MQSSVVLSAVLGKRCDNVIRDVLKLFGSLETRLYLSGVNKGKVAECFLTDPQAREYLQSRRTLPKEAKDLLEALGGVPSSGSAEGKFFDALDIALDSIFSFTGRRFTVSRQVSFDSGKHIFDFYIPEGPLLVEFDETGAHHSPEKNAEKDTAAICTLLRVKAGSTNGVGDVLSTLGSIR